MASKVKVTNNLPRFKDSAYKVFDDALREGARDILIISKNKAPHLTGGLRSDNDANKIRNLKWRVSYYKEYARFQEFGGDSSRRVRNYSTPGTGKHYLRNAGKQVSEKILNTFKKHGIRAKA